MKNIHGKAATVTYFWSAALLYVSHGFLPKEALTSEFGDKFLLSAFAWLGLIFDHHKETVFLRSMSTPFAIFAGISMLVGPFWAVIVFKDFGKRAAGLTALLSSGFAASWVVNGHYGDIAAILGGMVAPLAAAFVLTGFAFNSAKNAAVKAVGGETDDERRWRVERETRRNQQRQRRSG